MTFEPIDPVYRTPFEPPVAGDPLAAETVRRDVAAGERLLWAGRPPRGLLFRAQDAALVPFSLMWGGFAIFWETTVILQGAPLMFRLWGIPFVLVGLHMIFGRFFVDAFLRARTWYAVTDRRVLLVEVIRVRRVTAIELDRLEQVELTERTDGSGSITFRRTDGPAPRVLGPFTRTPRRASPPELVRIPEVRRVHELLMQAREALRRKRP